MPSRSNASSSAMTTRSAAAMFSGRSLSAGVASLVAMSAEPDELRRVEHAVARILAETETPVEVYEAALEAIGRPLEWELGSVWEVDPDDGLLRCVTTWNTSAVAEEFQAISERLALAAYEG